MKRLIVAICLALAGGSGMGLAAQTALAASLCVGTGPGCFSTIQLAVNAAQNGDTIQIGKGTFAGGIAIDKSLTLVGAGAKATIINGGGPVLTLGHYGAPPEPIISISGVTVSGGVNTVTSANPTAANPVGGGVQVPPATSGSVCNTNAPPECRGATVTITNSVITQNSAIATASTSCGTGCTFSLPLGGGIANFGVMTLTNTTVSDNIVTVQAIPEPTVDLPFGGGIETTDVATLTLLGSTVSGNAAVVTTGDSAFVSAGGGGINSDGLVSMEGSTVAGNTVSVASTNSTSDIFANAGGMRLTASASATVLHSVITGNSVTATEPGGAENTGANASAGGIDVDGSILLQDSTVANNRVRTSITSTTPLSNSFSDAGGMEIDGAATIQNTTFTGNSATSTSLAATANGGASPNGGALAMFTNQPVTITNSVISGNSLSAHSITGVVNLAGGGISNCSSTLTLTNTSVNNNTGTATGPSGTAQGGGIWNVDCGGGAPVLSLTNSDVTHNRLTASSGVTVQGGGLYTTAPVTLTKSTIAQNAPDQCFGC